MPDRVFDADKFLAARRRKGLRQPQVAAVLKVKTNQISRYETGESAPPPERLPTMASLVDLPLADLAPRQGLPDLKDLRCDAGIQQKDTAAITRTKSAMPVRGAENGMRRLTKDFEAPLAEAYDVSVEELRAAQERSFGNPVPDVRPRYASGPAGLGTPQTLAEKLNYLLESLYPNGQIPPTDAEIAFGVNREVGEEVLAADDVADLRTGAVTKAEPAVMTGLASVFDVSIHYFQDDEAVARDLMEAVRYLRLRKQGRIGRVAARGPGDQVLSADVLKAVNDFAESFNLDEWEQREGGAAD
ncbi:helix-turn-helix domain-containing protein [Streptomyces kanamyceticus]|uniref:Helix-turn-helix domain-containing protein n=1 Tax=Streptomyces kanamyceticus TaxID=1967 RepID=A0A5J6GRE4_STRKN|nr:helix-turn-helix transcriptional regulator [Streptomyces kanamyceticus]QEU96944.1 helix-turn-helix domain-containing protein [Streptomyces kanamyceticus]